MATTYEEFLAEATTEIENAKPVNININNEIRELTDAEYDDLIVRTASVKWDAYQYNYIEARQVAYGSIGDQLDMMYKDAINGTTTWQDHVAQVKADNPKPE